MREFAQAYDQTRNGDRRGAVALLRAAAQARPDEATAHLVRLRRIGEERTLGVFPADTCGCHVTKTLWELLNEAINAG